MKKILILAVAIFTLLAFASCGDGNNTPPAGNGDGKETVYSPDVDVRIVTPAAAEEYDFESCSNIAAHLLKLRGRMPNCVSDASEQSGPEIAIGRTNRAASVEAYRYLDENGDPNGKAYRIYYHDGVLAIAALNAESMALATEYASVVLFEEDTLKLKDNYAYGVTTPSENVEPTLEEIIASEIEKFDNRWSALVSEGATEETVNAFKRLYAFYGTDVISWFANLWESDICTCGECDPDSGELACYGGGFYYSNSARDYEGFLPDLESTRQALVFLRNSGMLTYYKDDLNLAIPEWMQEKILAFISACADPDGYYYHPQWGKNIGTSRRGRDLDWAIDLTNIFGGSFKYPTALDKLAGAASYTAERPMTSPLGASPKAAVSSVIATATAQDCLDSPENMLAWLRSLNFKADSHNNGHAVATLTSQIKAKGYGELVYNFFVDLMEEVQEELRDDAETAARKENPNITPAEIAEVRKNAENGLWQKEINYVSLSGLYKIGGMINTFGYDLPHEYAMAAVRSGVKAITLAEEPTIIVHVFNNWAGLNTQLSNMRSANSRAAAKGEPAVHDMEAAYSIVRAEAPSLIESTMQKLAIFRKSDGSFSYYQKSSLPNSQGVLSSMGFDEGDVNASMIALTSISNFMFNTMGYSRVSMYHLGHFYEFLDTVENLTPVEKIPLVKDRYLTFNDDDSLPQGISSSVASGSLTVIPDPTGKNHGNVLSFVSYAGVGDTFYVNQSANTPGMTSFAVEADYCIYHTNDSNSIDDYQLTIKAGNGNVYMYTFAYNSGSSVNIGDDSSTASGNTTHFTTVQKGEWFKLRIECYQLEDSSTVFKVFVDGKLVGTSRNFFGSEASGAKPIFGLQSVLIRALMRTDATLLIDNFKFETFNNVEYTEK